MSIGFGAKYGLGATDRVDLPAFTLPAVYSVWFWAFLDTGTTSGSVGNILQRNATRLLGATTVAALRIYSGTVTTFWEWTAKNAVWQSVGYTLDTGASTNDPTVYYDGTVLTVGAGLTQTGADAAHVTGSDVSYIGNVSTSNRIFGGALADFAVWTGALTEMEFARLRAGEHPRQIRPMSLVLHLPFDRDTKDRVQGLQATINAGTAWRADRPWRRHHQIVRPQFGVAAGGGVVTSSFVARLGAIGSSGASKSVALGLSAIAGSVGSASGTKSASAGISAISGLLGAMETAGVGTTDFNAIAGALVAVTHSTARLSTIEGRVGSIGSVAGLRGAISSLQAIAGSVAAIAGTTSLDRTSSFAAIAGAAAALSKTTARIADFAARAGALGTNTAATIRAAQIAAIAGLKAAIVGLNGEDVDTLLTVAVSAQAAYECVASARAAYNCTISEAIAA